MKQLGYVTYNGKKYPVFQDGGSMPLDLPLRSHSAASPFAYDSPTSDGYLLPDINRPELLNTGATEYKVGFDDVTIPSIVNGNYMDPETAYKRYLLTGEKFKPTLDPSAYSKFYDEASRLGIMKYQRGGEPTRADSLALYNNAIDKINFYKNNPDYEVSPSETDFKDKDIRQHLIDNAEYYYNSEISSDHIAKLEQLARLYNKPLSSEELQKLKNTIGEKRFSHIAGTGLTSFGDILDNDNDDYFNPLAPPIYLHPDIEPQSSVGYMSERFIDYSDIPHYEPLAIAPFDTLSEEDKLKRVKQYGSSGVPKSYLKANFPHLVSPQTTTQQVSYPNQPTGTGMTRTISRAQQPAPEKLNPISPGNNFPPERGLADTSFNISRGPRKKPMYVVDNHGNAISEGNPYGQVLAGEYVWDEKNKKWIVGTRFDQEEINTMRRLNSRQKPKEIIAPKFQSGGIKRGNKYNKINNKLNELDRLREEGDINILPYLLKHRYNTIRKNRLENKIESIPDPNNTDISEQMYAIVDPMGQYNHPGKETIIPSPRITMKGIPYPVLGVDDTGYAQLMEPNGEYMYPGNYVHEIPLMQQGGEGKYIGKYKIKNGKLIRIGD